MTFNFDYKPTKEDHGKWFFVRVVYPGDEQRPNTGLRQIRYDVDRDLIFLCPETPSGMEYMSYGLCIDIYKHLKLGFSEPIELQ